jgi:cyclic-di-GMP phosphodiesterase, flagellum assembly factor TipF
VARTARPSGGVSGDRLNDLEAALEMIDKDLQRIDRVEEDVSRLDGLTDRVERLDQAMGETGAGERAGGLARFDQFAQEFDEIHAKIENLRADLEGESRNQREKMTGDLRTLEGLIKQLSHELIATAETPAAVPDRAAPPPPALAEIEKIEPDDDEAEDAFEVEALEPVEEETVAVIEIEEEEIVVEPPPVEPSVPSRPSPRVETPRAAKPVVEEEPLIAADTTGIGDHDMLELVSQAIEAGRVDLYLQPTVTLPERRPRYFEAFTRIRTKTDSLILPGSYLPPAEASGMVPLIDNVLLVKSVQTLRRLGPESRIKGVFCNISVNTLLDPEFFPELVEFMEENSGLSESLVFELGQPAILGLNAAELGALDTLGALGYGFCLDHVADLDIDFIGLRERSFRFVKIDARTFLRGMEEKSGSFSAADMKRALEDFDIKLIVEKVEDEDTVGQLLDHGVELAQGHLFGKPKPMSPALFREIEDDAA